MFKLFKRIRAAVRPVLVVTGKIKYNETIGTYFFWPNYAKSNKLNPAYDLGHFTKHPCKFSNATAIGFFDKNSGELIKFTNGVDAATIYLMDN